MAFADPNAFTYDLGAIIRRLGQEYDRLHRERGQAWRIRYVTGLIDRFAFPAPIPVLVGPRLIDTVTGRSRWPIAAVDRWFDDRDPAGAAADDARARREGEEAMDARALQIAGAFRKVRRGDRVVRVVDGGRA